MRRTKPNFFHEIYNQPYDYDSRLRLTSSCKASLQLIQRMSLLERLKVHNGCVNSICWNNTGELILSGSDDQHLVLTNVYNYKVLTDYKTSHRANIFSAKFLPNNGDHRIVSCSGDGIILYTDLLRTSDTFHNQFNCHNGTAYEIATVPGEPHTFFSCGEDCTVRYFDLRVKSSCNTPRCKEDILILRSKAITAMSINPTKPHYLAIGCSDSSVAIYDRRMLTIGEQTWSDDNDGSWTHPLSMFTVPEFEGHPYRITSLCYSPDGNDVLVSYSSDHIYLFSEKTQTAAPLEKFSTCLVEKSKSKRQPPMRSPPPVRRLRLRGDWSDTGPDARPEREGGRRNGAEIAQARPMLQTSLMQRMTDVLSRMLNDPATRAALSGDNEETFQGVIDQHAEAQQHVDESNEIIHEERINDVQLMDAETNTENNDNNVGLQAEVEINLDADNIEGSLENRHEESGANTNSLNEFVENDECRDITVGNNESSQSEMSIVESTISPNLSRDNKNESDVMSNNNDANDMPTNMENARDETMMENLQDRLASMRDGFLEKHGSEPAVSLTYSDKSSTGATISLGVADEVTRDSYHPGPSGCQNLSGVKIGAARPSSSRTIGSVYDDVCESVDIYTDSDDDEVETSSKRIKNPIETEMDEAVMNARESLGQNESFGKNTNTEFHVRKRYMGHRNASHNVDEGLLASAPNPYYSDRLSFPGFDSSFFRTMIKEANFWGNDFVMSGSDCGHVFVWERETAKLCMILEADQHVVNCLQPHPFLPMLATSGIDYDVKLWAPINEEASFDTNFAEDLQKRNAVMLEETKDTITVPAVFMIRMLACLNQIRRGRGRNRRRSGNETDELRGG